ncbi:MAG: Ig-like domain-containing protein, partial [Roseovarius sp.]|nr:Ig-like domain-containing protein [Roseovarius sp.]
AKEETEEPLQDIVDEVAEITDATRLGFASFDFTPVNPGPDDELATLLRSDVDDILTPAQQRFRLDALFNADRNSDRVVIDTKALFDALKKPSREDGFDPIKAFAETIAWTYAHEIAHTLGLPDLYDFTNGAPLEGAGIMGLRNDFTLTSAHEGAIRLASDNPEAGAEADVSAVLDMLRTARAAGVLAEDETGNRDYLLAPPVGSLPLRDTGWNVLGNVTQTPAGALDLVETAISRTSAYRALQVPAGASELTFTIRSRLGVAEYAAPDAFEVALLRNSGTPLTVLSGLSNTDAALNLQGSGQLRLANGLSVVDRGVDFDGFAVREVTVDLAQIGGPAAFALSFDLLGFGGIEARVLIEGLTFDVPSALNNTAPVLTGGSSVTLDEDASALIDLRPLVTDAEGDPLTIEITQGPANGTLVAVEPGVWRYTPSPDFNGTDILSFTASDGVFRPFPAILSLVVRPQNDAPVLAGTARATVKEGDQLLLQIAAADIDGDPLTYTLEDGPAGAAITADGGLSWTAPDGPTTRIFRILADDGHGGQARQTLTVDVENAAPVLTLTAPDTSVVETAARVSFAATDPGGDAIGPVTIDWGDGTTEVLPAGATGSSHTYTRLGRFAVTLTATDEEGAEGRTTQVIEVVTPGLRVTQVTSGAWGVNVRFNEAVDTGLPNPYRLDTRPGEPVDVMLLDAEGNPVRGSLVPDADERGFTFLATEGALPPGEYRLRLTADDLGWRSRWDVLEAGPLGYEERVITISEAPVTLALQGAVQTAGQALGVRGSGLAVTMTQSGGLRSMVVQVSWDADLMQISGLVSKLAGAMVSRVDAGGTPGQATFRIAFDTAPEAGTVEIARLMGRMNAGANYGTSGAPLRMRVAEINGVATADPAAPALFARAFGEGAFGRAAPAPAASETRALTLVAQRGDADGDGTVSAADLARFAALPEDSLEGLSAWAFIDPNLLRPLPSEGGATGDDDTLQTLSARTGRSGTFGDTAVRSFSALATGNALSLIDAAQEATGDGGGNQLLYLRYTTPQPLCLVPEHMADDPGAAARAARAGLCFDGLPADLSDADQIWRLNGITPVGQQDHGEVTRAADGEVCIVGALPEGAEPGDTYRLAPLPRKDQTPAAATEAAITEPGDLPAQFRMCFDEMDSVEAAPATPQEDAALDVAPSEDRLSSFTALALLSAAVPTRPGSTRTKNGHGSARHAILLSDMNESDQGAK